MAEYVIRYGEPKPRDDDSNQKDNWIRGANVGILRPATPFMLANIHREVQFLEHKTASEFGVQL